MTINTTTVEASLQTALNATTGSTAAKELLLLGKAAEAITTVGSSLTSVLTAHGDVLYRNATGPARLAAGASGQVLKSGGAGANPVWGAASGVDNFELAGNMTANQIAQIDSTGKIEAITQSASITASLMTNTIYPAGQSNQTGHACHAAVDPSNTNRFAVVMGGDARVIVGLVAADGSVSWGSDLQAGYAAGAGGHHDLVWDPVNDGVLWHRAGYSGSGITRWSVSGTTMTQLGTFSTSTGYNWGTLSLHPTVSGRFIITNRASNEIKYCNLDSNTSFTTLSTTSIGADTANSHIGEFFPDDGSKILLLYGQNGGSKARVADVNADNSLTLGTEVVMGDAGTAYFRAKGFAWEPNGDSTTGYRFGLLVNGLTGASAHDRADFIVGSVTSSGSGTVAVGTAFNWSETTVGGNTALSLETSEYISNIAFSPFNKTSVVIGTNFIGACTLDGLEITAPTTLVSKTISGNGVSLANGSYPMLVNLGATGKYLSLMEGTGGAILNQHAKAPVSSLSVDKVMGFVTATGSTGDTKAVQYSGQLGGFSGLTIGAKHYVQQDATVTSTKVASSVFVGIAVNATTIQVRI